MKNEINKNNSKQITKVIKYGSKIMGYEIENGHQIGKAAAIEMAKKGEIKGVTVGISSKGDEYLRSLPDDNAENNLSNLPTINVR